MHKEELDVCEYEYNGYEEVEDEYTDSTVEETEEEDEEDAAECNAGDVDAVMNEEYKVTYKNYTGAQVAKMFDDFAKAVRELDKNDPECKKAKEMALMLLEGMIVKMANKKFATYIEADPTIRDDLIQEGRIAVMKELDNYSSEKGAVTTYYYNRIRGAMFKYVKRVKCGINSEWAGKIKCLKEVKTKFDRAGITPTPGDYMAQTGLDLKKIESTLDLIRNTAEEVNIDTIFTDLGQGKSDMFRSPESKAIEKDGAQNILAIMKRCLTEFEYKCLLLYSYSYSIKEIASVLHTQEIQVKKACNNSLDVLRQDYRLHLLYPEARRSEPDDAIIFERPIGLEEDAYAIGEIMAQNEAMAI